MFGLNTGLPQTTDTRQIAKQRVLQPISAKMLIYTGTTLIIISGLWRRIASQTRFTGRTLVSLLTPGKARCRLVKQLGTLLQARAGQTLFTRIHPPP